MKLALFFILAGVSALAALWFAGVSFSNLAIVFMLLSANGIFQLWARGNAEWNAKMNHDSMKNKISLRAYAIISTTGLLAIVIYISRITYALQI